MLSQGIAFEILYLTVAVVCSCFSLLKFTFFKDPGNQNM